MIHQSKIYYQFIILIIIVIIISIFIIIINLLFIRVTFIHQSNISISKVSKLVLNCSDLWQSASGATLFNLDIGWGRGCGLAAVILDC